MAENNSSFQKGKKLNSKSFSDHIEAQYEVSQYDMQWMNQLNDKFKKIESLVKQINKMQEDAGDKKVKSLEEESTKLKEQLLIMKQMEQSGDYAVEKKIKIDTELAEAWENVAKAQYKIMSESGNASESQLERILQVKQKAEESAKKTKTDLKKTEEALKIVNSGKATEKFVAGVKELSSDLMKLANTQNLNKIVTGMTGGSIDDKMSLMNSTKATFGMTSTKEFEGFKNSLMSETQSLNKTIGKSMFGAKDVRNYMSQLANIGITSTQLAQQQLKAALVGNKYLGVSEESQRLMVQTMKKNGDTTLMTKQNNKIASLLSSQINLSKEQLDEITKAQFKQSDALLNLGPEAYEKFNNTFTPGQAALTESFGENVAGSIKNIYDDLLMNGTSSQYAGKFSNLGGMLDSVQGGDYQKFTDLLLNDSLFKQQMNMLKTNSNSGEIRQGLGIDSNMSSIGNILNSDSLNLYKTKLAEANTATSTASDKKTQDLVANQEISLLDQIKNKLSLTFDKLPWGVFFSLANVAFGLYIASKSWEVIKSIKNFVGKGIDLIKLGKNAKDVVSVAGNAASAASNVAAGGAAKTGLLAKTGTFLKGAFTTAGKSGLGSVLSSTGAKVLGGVGGGIALGVDAYKGVKKADAWGTSKTSAGIGGALGGTSSGWKGALGGAAKGAAIGTMFGPIGTAVGAGVGGILGAIGGKNIAKGFDAIGDFAKKSGKAIGNWAKKGLEDFKEQREKRIEQQKEMVKAIGNGLSKGWNKVKGWFGKGGPEGVYGVGGGGADYSHKPWPITAGYPKYPSGKSHKGVDFGVSRKTPVGSSTSGTVESIVRGITREGWLGNTDGYGWGNHVRVRGLDGNLYTYAHLSQVNVNRGDKINAGTVVGLSGNTGSSTGPHLHYQVNGPTGGLLDPFNYFSDSIWYPGNTSGISYYATEDGSSSSQTSSNNTKISSIAARSKYISPSLLARIGGTGGGYGVGGDTGSSVNGAADRIIAKLDELAARQNEQETLLQAFSNSNRVPREFGGAY